MYLKSINLYYTVGKLMNLRRCLLTFKFMHKYINGCAAAVVVHIILMFEQLTVHIDDVQGPFVGIIYIFISH